MNRSFCIATDWFLYQICLTLSEVRALREGQHFTLKKQNIGHWSNRLPQKKFHLFYLIVTMILVPKRSKKKKKISGRNVSRDSKILLNRQNLSNVF